MGYLRARVSEPWTVETALNLDSEYSQELTENDFSDGAVVYVNLCVSDNTLYRRHGCWAVDVNILYITLLQACGIHR